MSAQHALTPDAAPLRCAAQVKRKPLGGNHVITGQARKYDAFSQSHSLF